MTTKTCDDHCWHPDDKPHLEPEVEWVGDMPLMHGERDVPSGDPQSEYCLCGRPNYLTCPEWITGGIATMVVDDPYGGRL